MSNFGFFRLKMLDPTPKICKNICFQIVFLVKLLDFMQKKIFKIFRKQKGVTLIELMIVLVIITVIAAISIPSFLKNIQQTKFEKKINEIVILFEQARAQALSSKIDKTADQKIPPGGYGVHLDSNENNQKAILFIDDWNDTLGKKVNVDYLDFANRVIQDSLFTEPNSDGFSNGDSILEIIPIDDSNYLKLNSFDGEQLSDFTVWDYSPNDTMTIIFEPPYANVNIIANNGAENFELQNFTVQFKFTKADDIFQSIYLNRITTSPQIE
jgi:prepilin-type N-terminal cleavage/methylation domain-containing protein